MMVWCPIDLVVLYSYHLLGGGGIQHQQASSLQGVGSQSVWTGQVCTLQKGVSNDGRSKTQDDWHSFFQHGSARLCEDIAPASGILPWERVRPLQ